MAMLEGFAVWGWERRQRLMLVVLLAACGLVAASSLGPVSAAVQVGSDEHYELTKALLWARGHSRYQEVWDDQPPLHTALLGLSFKAFGPMIGVARVLAVAFGLSLLAGCWVLVNRRRGTVAAFVATACLLVAPQVFQLSVSAMLEVPAIGTALWALWPILRWQESLTRELAQETSLSANTAPSPHPSPIRWERVPERRVRAGWLALSGIIFAAALQIKLTAAVVAPALVVEILLGVWSGKGRPSVGQASRLSPETFPTGEPAGHGSGETWRWRQAGRLSYAKAQLRSLAIWGGSLVSAYVLLALVLGHVPLDVLWASHFSPHTLAQGESLAFSLRLLLDHTEAMWAAGAGLVLLVLRRDWRRMAFPLVWLLTVALVHFEHRPWWSYYYLHFAVPLAWLSGYAVAELLRFAWAKAPNGLLRPPFLALGSLVAASLLMSLVAGYGGERLLSEVERIRALPRVQDDPLVAKMKTYAGRTRWVYTRQTIYPFHAGLLVVPELAVLPAKRFWSGQINDEQILAIVKRYHPEQLLLGEELLNPGMREFVAADYTLVYQDGEHSLYVAKSLAEQ